jgi:hypothetical protein
MRTGPPPAWCTFQSTPAGSTRSKSSPSSKRKVIKPQDFADLQALADRLDAFEDRYNATAEPFDWHYTRQSLDRHLERLTLHEPQAA